jgi:hypothetical protein
MTFNGHPLHEKQLAYFRHMKTELEARETKTKSTALRRNFLMRQKINNYQNEHDRIARVLSNNLVPNTTRDKIRSRVSDLEKLGASAFIGIKD